MTVSEFVTALEAEGFRIREQDGNLVINPARRVTSTMKETLTGMGREILVYLQERKSRADWSRVSLFQLDRVLEVAIPWSDVRLLIAPGCRIARELRAKDPKPGRVWCVCEVLDLLLSSVTPDDARKVAETRLLMDAKHMGVRGEGASRGGEDVT